MPAPAIFFFARVIRAAIVASLTRNARATSTVVRPQTSRRVSATFASRDGRVGLPDGTLVNGTAVHGAKVQLVVDTVARVVFGTAGKVVPTAGEAPDASFEFATAA